MAKLFDFEAVLSQLPEILKYLPTTLILAVSSMIIALIIGMLLALIKTKNIPLLKQIAGVYISLIRGTPVIVQLYIAYFGIPMITKIHIPAKWMELSEFDNLRFCVCDHRTFYQ